MLSQKTLSDIRKLWEIFRTGGFVNSLVIVEQITYLILAKRFAHPADWQTILHAPPELSLATAKKIIPDRLEIPPIKDADLMSDAALTIREPRLLWSASLIIDSLFHEGRSSAEIGAIYEYMLSLVHEGEFGQFWTPRSIVYAACELLDPMPHETVIDPVCGTGGYLIGACHHQQKRAHINDDLKLMADGRSLSVDERELSPLTRSGVFLYGYDLNRTIARISLTNLLLHGIEQPHIRSMNMLSAPIDRLYQMDKTDGYDVLFASVPSLGNVSHVDISEDLQWVGSRQAQLLFLELSRQLLKENGRAAVVVTEGVLSNANSSYQKLRFRLVTDNQLLAVISLPEGAFRPYHGVKTSILVFQKGGSTREVWYYDVRANTSLEDQSSLEEQYWDDLWDMVLKYRLHYNLPRPTCVDVATWNGFQNMSPEERHIHYAQPRFEKKQLADHDGNPVDVQILSGLEVQQSRTPREWTVSLQAIEDAGYELSAMRHRTQELIEAEYAPPEQIIRSLKQNERTIQANLDILLHMIEEGSTLQPDQD